MNDPSCVMLGSESPQSFSRSTANPSSAVEICREGDNRFDEDVPLNQDLCPHSTIYPGSVHPFVQIVVNVASSETQGRKAGSDIGEPVVVVGDAELWGNWGRVMYV